MNEVKVNGKAVTFDQSMTMFKYMPKSKGYYELPVCDVSGNNLEIECNWEYRKVYDYLNS